VQTDWTLDTGAAALAVLDWENDRYWDGSSLLASMTTLCQNGTRDSNGLITNAGNINVIGAALTALQTAGGATSFVEVSGGNSGNYGILCMSSGGPDGIFIADVGGPNTMDSFNGTSMVGPVNQLDFSVQARYANAYNNSGLITNATQNVIANYAKNFSTITAAQYGSYAGGAIWPGRIRKLGIFSGKLADKYLKNYTWTGKWYLPLFGNTGINPRTTSNIAASTALAAFFNTTNQWSMVANILHASARATELQVIFTNVATTAFSPPWYGHETYINTNGKIRVMIFSGWAGGAATTNLIQVDGTTNLADDTWHSIGVTYDGSGVGAGIKVYIDGVAESVTVTYDNITGPTDTVIGNLSVGGQYGGFTLDYIDFFSIASTVRSASYFSNILTTKTRPATDPFTLVQYDFREGSGNTVFDRSGNGYDATYDNTLVGGGITWI
jgi:hypothetical protein